MSCQRVRVTDVHAGTIREREDHLAVEEPLEIRTSTPNGPTPLAVTMRTPGHDLELAAGFLLAEGVVREPADIRTAQQCRRVPLDQRDNTVLIELTPEAARRARTRRFTVSSSCGVCGSESLAALSSRGVGPVRATKVDPAVVLALPDQLRAAQKTFSRTGGLHAAGLVSPDGDMLCVREDVGRHNAVDKVIGWALQLDRLPLHEHTLVVSGRASFELVQKAVVAGIGVLAAVSAPSSLAVSVAESFGLALAGFVRDERLVLYTGELAL